MEVSSSGFSLEQYIAHLPSNVFEQFLNGESCVNEKLLCLASKCSREFVF